jgi:hypothetical protein
MFGVSSSFHVFVCFYDSLREYWSYRILANQASIHFSAVVGSVSLKNVYAYVERRLMLRLKIYQLLSFDLSNRRVALPVKIGFYLPFFDDVHATHKPFFRSTDYFYYPE